MFYQKLLLQKMRHTEELDLVEVDSCVKLLDHEVAIRRKRRNSMPFSLPSIHAITDSISNLRHRSNTKSSLIPQRNLKYNPEISPVTPLINESLPDKSKAKSKSTINLSTTKSKNSQAHEKHLDHFTDDQRDEFLSTWRRIQGSRINLTD